VNDLKKELQKHYEKVELSENRLNQLEVLQHRKTPFYLNFRFHLASIMAVVLLITFLPGNPSLEKMAQEVIYNHNKNMPSKVTLNNLGAINGHLEKLNFTVVHSRRLAADTVVGARYCSLGGNIAAQIKMKRGKDFYTLYQAKVDGVDQTQLPYRFKRDGVEVLIWQEGDVLFAKASGYSK
jgi:hypothetical protein